MSNTILTFKALHLIPVLEMIGAVWLNDLSWAFYTRRTAAGKAIQAGLAGSFIILTGAVMTVLFIDNLSLLFIEAAASFIGTAVVVHLDSRKSNGNS